MVCLGNICRSPLAEGILAEKAAKAGLAWFVDSAGTSDYHIGEPPHPLAQKVSLLNGIDISTQRCRQFVENDLMKFDKIYAMDSANYLDIKRLCGKNWQNDKVKLILEELHPGKNMEVPDPWYGGEDGFHQVFKLLDDACERIIQPYTTALK